MRSILSGGVISIESYVFMKEFPVDIEFYLEAIHFAGLSLDKEKTWNLLGRLAKSGKNILILGETGTGKDVLARKIHAWSERKEGPFVAINCASIPADLFEAELFGFSKGAFTGAYREKIGLLEMAERGTAFLDEIGELPLSLQAKLLRVIENRTFRRLGEVRDRYCQARFIFATNKDLKTAVKTGQFRLDLYYRLSPVQIHIDPLRFHLNLLPQLIHSILERENRAQAWNKKITAEALQKLMTYDFPGNIRELINILERAMILSEDNLIRAEDIQFDRNFFRENKPGNLSPDRLRVVLEACRWNKTEAARKIGTSRRHLYRLLQKYNLDCLI